jgi:hypothetical protein
MGFMVSPLEGFIFSLLVYPHQYPSGNIHTGLNTGLPMDGDDTLLFRWQAMYGTLGSGFK